MKNLIIGHNVLNGALEGLFQRYFSRQPSDKEVDGFVDFVEAKFMRSVREDLIVIEWAEMYVKYMKGQDREAQRLRDLKDPKKLREAMIAVSVAESLREIWKFREEIMAFPDELIIELVGKGFVARVSKWINRRSVSAILNADDDYSLEQVFSRFEPHGLKLPGWATGQSCSCWSWPWRY